MSYTPEMHNAYGHADAHAYGAAPAFPSFALPFDGGNNTGGGSSTGPLMARRPGAGLAAAIGTDFLHSSAGVPPSPLPLDAGAVPPSPALSAADSEASAASLASLASLASSAATGMTATLGAFPAPSVGARSAPGSFSAAPGTLTLLKHVGESGAVRGRSSSVGSGAAMSSPLFGSSLFSADILGKAMSDTADVPCVYCNQRFRARLLEDHTLVCGLRTESCFKCGATVAVRDRSEHHHNVHGGEPPSVMQTDAPAAGWPKTPRHTTAGGVAPIAPPSPLAPKNTTFQVPAKDAAPQTGAQAGEFVGGIAGKQSDAKWDAEWMQSQSMPAPPPRQPTASHQRDQALAGGQSLVSNFPPSQFSSPQTYPPRALGAAPPTFSPAKPPASNFAVSHMQTPLQQQQLHQQQMQARATQRGYLVHPQSPMNGLQPLPSPGTAQYGMAPIKSAPPAQTPYPQYPQYQSFGSVGQPGIPVSTGHVGAAAPQQMYNPSGANAAASNFGASQHLGSAAVFTASKLNTKHRPRELGPPPAMAPPVHTPPQAPVPVAGATSPGTLGSLGTGKKDRKSNAPTTTANLRIRLWDGSELRHEFPASEMMGTVIAWVAMQPVIQNMGFGPANIALSTTFPFRTFQPMEYDSLTLAAAGLTPRGFLLLKPR